MLPFWPWLSGFMKNIIWILRHGSPLGRLPLLLTYIRIELKRKVLVHWLGRKLDRETIFGQTLCFSRYEWFAIGFEEIYLGGMYYLPLETRSPRIIDCGANIGLSLAYFLTVYPGARIAAFEAEPETFQIVSSNRDRNRWTSVELHNRALQRENGTVLIHSFAAAPGSMVASLRTEMTGRPCTRTTEVESVKLSDYLDGEIDILKIDIEGSEHGVLEDLVESGKIRLVRRIILEYHHHMMPREDRFGAFLSLLEKAGFGYDFRAPGSFPISPMQPHYFLLFAYPKN